MKKILFVTTLFALLCLGAKKPLTPTVQFTIINESGMNIAVQLSATVKDCTDHCDTLNSRFYYLSVPKGEQEWPTTRTYEIDRGNYKLRLYYLETYDPVYGFECGGGGSLNLNATHYNSLVVMPCDKPAANGGGEGNYKLPAGGGRRHPSPVPIISVKGAI